MPELEGDDSSSRHDDEILRVLRASPAEPVNMIESSHELLAQLKRLPQQSHRPEPPRLDTIHYLGDYELLEQLGHGGMGVVYRAMQRTLQREVAVKLLLGGQYASPAARVRFRREAEAIAQLDHPHILPIYETGEQDNQPFFSMKLVLGGSLAQAKQSVACNDRLPQDEQRRRQIIIAQVIKQLASAVHHSHQHGIMHRDIKPSNVLLEPSGVPYLSDFGLAKDTGSDLELTQSGAIVGTPSYMSPEQAAGDKQITTAADIYGLGAILYELLTGEPPFLAESAAKTLQRVMQEDVMTPRVRNRHVDPDLETICLRCLARRPADRFPSAAEVEEELDRYLKNEPILSRPISKSERLWKWAKRRPAAAMATILTLAAALTLLMVLLISRAAIQDARHSAEQALHETRVTLAKEQHANYLRTVALAYQDIQHGDVRHATQLLAACEPSEQDWEWNFLSRKCKQTFQELKSANPFLYDLKYSPDGKWLVALTFDIKANRAVIERWDTTTWKPVAALIDADASIESSDPWRFWPSLSFSPDGRELAYTCFSQSETKPVAPATEFTGIVRRIRTDDWSFIDDGDYQQPGRFFVGVMYTKAGACLAVSKPAVQQDQRDAIVDYELHDLLKQVTVHRFSAYQRGHRLQLSSDETRFLIIGGCIETFDLETCKVKVNSSYGRAVGDAMWLPGSASVLAVDLNGRAFITDFDFTSQQTNNRLAIQSHANYARRCVLTADGQRFATVGHDGMVRLWDVTSGQELESINFGGRLLALTVRSHSQNEFAFADDTGQIGVWRGGKQNVLRKAAVTGNPVELSNVSRSGKAVALLDAGDTTTKWDLSTLTSSRTIKMFEPARDGIDQLDVLSIALNPTGSLICASLGDAEKMDRLGGKVKVWSFEDGTLLGAALQPGFAANALLWDQQSDFIFSVSYRGLVGWRWPGLDIAWQGQPSEGDYQAIALRPGHSQLYASRWATSGSFVDILDSQTGRLITTVELSLFAVQGLCFTSDGRYLAVAGFVDDRNATNRITVIDVSNQTVVSSMSGGQDGLVQMAFTPSNRRLIASTEDGNVLVWDWSISAEVLNLRGEGTGIFDFSLSPRGVMIAAEFQGLGVFLLDGSELDVNATAP